MPKLDLGKTEYTWQGIVYGPGVADVPDGLALALQPRGIYPVDEAAPDPMAEFPQLVKAGYTSDALRLASDDDLLAVEGVGKATLAKVRSAFPATE